MDDDRRLVVPGAKSIPIRIEGEWSALDWTGVVSADEEIACVLLVRYKDGISWSRSRRTGQDGMVLRLSFGSDPAVAETWFSVDLGGGSCWGRVSGQLDLEFAKAVPDSFRHTSRVTWFPVCAETKRPLEIGLLALVRSDVRFGRKRIWRLRPELRESLNHELRLMLVDHRFGTLPK